jgi:hypothetical protein
MIRTPAVSTSPVPVVTASASASGSSNRYPKGIATPAPNPISNTVNGSLIPDIWQRKVYEHHRATDDVLHPPANEPLYIHATEPLGT